MSEKKIDFPSVFAAKVHDMYLDYFNQFLTVESFALYYGFNVDFAKALIAEAKRLESRN